MSYGYIPELPTAIVLGIERRRDIAREVHSATARRRNRTRPTVRARVTAWIDRHRSALEAPSQPGPRPRARPRISTHF